MNRRLLPTLASVVLIAGCGSTVQLTGSRSTADGGLGAISTGAPTSSGAPGVSLPGATGTTTTATPGGGGSGSTTPGGATTAPGTGGPTNAISTSKVKPPISIGFLVTTAGNAAALGLNAGQTFTAQQLMEAAVKAMNLRGGVGGRRIIPVYSQTDTATTNWSSAFQAACANFTQDHHVQAVLGYTFGFFDSFEACLSKAGAVHVDAAYDIGDAQALRDYPDHFGTTNPSVDVRYLLQLQGAVISGNLTPKNKLGIMNDECVHSKRGFNNTVPAYIKKAGLNLVATQTLSCPVGASDVSGVASQIQSAVLKFRTNGVDRVFIEGVPAIVFATEAQSQNWYPTYLVTSTTGGAALEPNLPKTQLANFKGSGWFPVIDVNRANQPPLRPEQTLCLKMLKEQGIVPQQYGDFHGVYTTCDSLFLYDRLLRATGGDASKGAVSRVMDSYGSAYAGVTTLDGQTLFNGTRHFGPATWRAWGWVGSCSCFRYYGPSHPMPDL